MTKFGRAVFALTLSLASFALTLLLMLFVGQHAVKGSQAALPPSETSADRQVTTLVDDYAPQPMQGADLGYWPHNRLGREKRYSSTSIDSMETVNGWVITASNHATATITTVPGYTGTAIQISYTLGITQGTGSWVQIYHPYSPPLDLSDGDDLRFYYQGTMTNTLEVGLVSDGIWYPAYGWGNGRHQATYHSEWITATWDFRVFTNTQPITDLSEIDGIFISVANQRNDWGSDWGGRGTLTIDELQYLVVSATCTSPIYIGAYLSGTRTISFTDELDWFDDVSGKHAALINVFVGWYETLIFPTDIVSTIIAHHSAPMITLQPYSVTLTDVPKGVYNDEIDDWADAISQTPVIVFLRWGHEMNGNWYPSWSGDPEAYKDAWRYVHDYMEITKSVKNIAWVWTPNHLNVPDEPWNDYKEYYPGNDYVDWVGASGYNFAEKAIEGPKPCRSFDEIFSSILYDMAGRYDKPQMVPEFASACDNGCNKALWITEAYHQALLYPRLQALVWFNVAKWEGWVDEQGDHRKLIDWRLDCGNDCPDCEKAYRQALTHPCYTACPIAPLTIIYGPTRGTVNTVYAFTATINPTATTPTTYTWQATNYAETVHIGDRDDVLTYTWSTNGIKIITVTAVNECGAVVSKTHTITISPHRVYLPVIFKSY